jgi:hypothetical protein
MAASVIDFQINKIEMEFLHANRMSESSHSLGQNRLLARAIAMSALPLMNRHRPPFRLRPKSARSGHSARSRGWVAQLAGAVRRLRMVGVIGVVLGYSRDEPAGGERLQV